MAHSFWVICSNVSRIFVELCMETPYWCTVLVKSTKTSGVHFFYKSSFFTRELAYVRINISSNIWNGYTAEIQEVRLFFNDTAFLLWCMLSRTVKTRKFKCCIFELKHATWMEPCTKIFYLFIFNLV